MAHNTGLFIRKTDGYHNFTEFDNATLPGIVVPQAGDNHQSRAESLEIVSFAVRGAGPGIRLGPMDAISPQLASIDQERQMQLVYGAPELTIRILWPGYPAWEKRVPVGGPNVKIPLSRFAAVLAAAVMQYLKEMSVTASSEGRADWWISRVGVESLVLLEARRTGPGTWQPVLCRVV
ncbi:hypothetical protein PsYK624_091000 [Phanerochaete sordida]|uniref:Uncharacterized protein n=1 Tax=Phanerochaete sordida TaxID=48140 RepID=A0A9P3GDT5_9APHY|nr:hypothetical protein PsYK624_091000 [Phanerochaete sordida]